MEFKNIRKAESIVLGTIAGILYILSLLYLSSLTDTSIFIVIIGMFPLLLYTVLFLILNKKKKVNGIVLWFTPILFAVIFYFMEYYNLIAELKEMDLITLGILNVFIAYIINLLLLFIHKFPRVVKTNKSFSTKKVKTEKKSIKPINVKKIVKKNTDYKNILQKYDQQLVQDKSIITQLKTKIQEYENYFKITQEKFQKTIRSVEDKCKAINFVVGRVYSDKNGGDKDVRDFLRIDRELYNTFSEIANDFNDKQAKEVYNILNEICKKLSFYELTEKDIFSNKLIHSNKMNEKIIEILSRLDKDPVRDYYTETQTICKDLINYLKSNYGF